MAAIKQRIEEIDVVELLDSVDGWPTGTTGTVVHDFGEVKTVEISNERGETLGLPSISTDRLRLVTKHST
jgi:hypothetical protein